jgi:DivIVA domain-containing protein
MSDDDEILTGGSRPRLTPVEVQQQQFKRSFRGYDEQEVDDFLDRVTEDIGFLLEESDRLKEQARSAPTTPVEGAAGAADASRTVAEIKRNAEAEAEGIIRDAHARADAIVRDAEARGGAIGRGASFPAGAGRDSSQLSRFVTRERTFLQELAALIQSHAEGVKSMVQEARQAQSTSESAGPDDDTGRRSQEPFGPAGLSAGRDIDAADDATAAVAGTAEADEGTEVGPAPQRAETAPVEADRAQPVDAEARRTVIVPEAPEDRVGDEVWADREIREGSAQKRAGASVTFGGAAAERKEKRERGSERAPASDESLGDLFWGEE